MPIVGPIYQELISDHDLIGYIAFALVPMTYWALYSTRFGLRLRAVGENPGRCRHRGHFGARPAL